MIDYYQILDIEKNAPLDKIKKAFRQKARLSHPDLNPNNPEAECLFKLIREAYEAILKDYVAISNTGSVDIDLSAELKYSLNQRGRASYADISSLTNYIKSSNFHFII